jgi:hypothetical protein
VDDCVAALSGRVQDAHRPEAVGHLLGEAPVDRGGVGELGCVEERRQVPWKQAGCIVGAGEAEAILDRDESAPDDDPAAAPERPAGAGDAQLVLVGEEQVELELRVAEERGKADEPVEDVLDASAPRRASGRERFALVADPDDPADKRDGCNETHAMVPGELLQLAAKGGEAARLDLDQQLAADEVDNETVDELLDAIAGAAVPVLELSVQHTLVERPNRGEPADRAVLEDGGHAGLFFVATGLPSPPATNPSDRGTCASATQTRPRSRIGCFARERSLYECVP